MSWTAGSWPLLELKYGGAIDGVADLGGRDEEVSSMFAGFLRHVYEASIALNRHYLHIVHGLADRHHQASVSVNITGYTAPQEFVSRGQNAQSSDANYELRSASFTTGRRCPMPLVNGTRKPEGFLGTVAKVQT